LRRHHQSRFAFLARSRSFASVGIPTVAAGRRAPALSDRAQRGALLGVGVVGPRDRRQL